MAILVKLNTYKDNRGSLTVIENDLGFKIERLFYIYKVPSGEARGKHGHKRTKMGLVSISGACKVRVCYKEKDEVYRLQSPEECLLLEPHDWHEMYDFEPGSVLLVLASQKYDPNDYFTEILK